MGNLSSAPAYARDAIGYFGVSNDVWIALIVCVRIFNMYLT